MGVTKLHNMKLEKVDDKTAYENLLVKYAELENKIADIKANCDLAIEGRDIKIKELEKVCQDLSDKFDYQVKQVMKLEKENAELIQENEEMKKGLGCETCQIHLEYMRLNDKIRELEQKLEQTEEDLADYQFNYPTIKELEKENAELKADNDARRFAMAMSEKVEKQLREYLTKAKELIENIIRVTWGEGWNYSLDWKVKAEQFLKEIEE